MLVVLAVVVSAVALLAVAYPILASARRSVPAARSSEETLEELLAHRDAAFQAIRDLNFDHQVGKISDEDFGVFEANLKRAAADALRALDSWENRVDRDLDEIVEAEIAARRAALSGPAFPCPSCGRSAAPGDQFCTGCGKPLPEARTLVAPGPAGPACPHCGRSYEPGDLFCSACGKPIQAVREAPTS